MKLPDYLTLGMVAALASCGPQRQPPEATNNSSAPVLPAPSAPPAVSNSAPAAQPQPQPQAETTPTVDPKSSEAAVAVVHGFADLLNDRKFDEAYMLLGTGAPPRAEFDRQFTRYSDLRVEVGPAGDQEGAAGSIYLSVPLTISGLMNGEHSTRAATAILRRVNDVPGSTEAERHWHIERIDWGESN